MASVYTIASNLNGHQHSVQFYPAGHGYAYDDYITSFDQYQDALKSAYNSSAAYKLMYISASSQLKEIEDDYDLFSAAKNLDNGACLSVTLVESKKKNNKNNNKSKNNKNNNKKKQEQEDWYVDGSDSEDNMTEYDSSDDEYDYSQEKPSKNNKKRYNNKLPSKLAPILQRFVTQEADCHHCDRTEWTGARYEYAMNSGYSMCEDCHTNLSKADKKQWPLASHGGLPWEDDVPDYPLYREEGCPIRDATTHLQYILTRIGLMPLNHTDALVGSYQSNTQRAVEKFRKQYNITGGDLTVYNKKTAGKLGEIVQKLRAEGHKYI